MGSLLVCASGTLASDGFIACVCEWYTRVCNVSLAVLYYLWLCELFRASEVCIGVAVCSLIGTQNNDSCYIYAYIILCILPLLGIDWSILIILYASLKVCVTCSQ